MLTDTDAKYVTTALKENAGVTVAIGVALTIFGILAIMAPLFTGAAVTILVGILMIAAGITRGVFAFRAQTSTASPPSSSRFVCHLRRAELPSPSEGS